MAKRQKKPQAPKPPEKHSFGSAFAGLAGLRDALPQGESPEPTVEEDAAAAESEVGVSSMPPKLVLQRERKGRGGKTITRLSGLDAEASEHWAKTLKKKLGCGAVVEGDDVILLGDVSERARDLLEAAGAKRVVIGN